MGDHDRGVKVGEFCTVPGEPCSCGENYRKNCAPGWSSFSFARILKLKTGPIGSVKGYEAHHILCVASVTTMLSEVKNLEGILKQTKWCINHKPNMIAMPLWGHTVKHYCTITALGGMVTSVVPPPPPFANIPQHDWDHNCKLGYTWEVTKSVEEIAKSIEAVTDPHEIKAEDIKGALNDLSDHYRSELDTRGSSRQGGTHAAWISAASPTPGMPANERWYEPFSMATVAVASQRSFPVKDFNTRVQNWINKLAQALK